MAHPYNSKDNALQTYLDELDKLVNDSAQLSLQLDVVPQGGYYDRWIFLAADFLENGTSSAFLCAAYGYAVETMTNAGLKNLDSKLPQGWSSQTQVCHGTTRPDIVLFDNAKTEVAWIDITSSASVGHIKNKVGSGWSSKDYVYEISYPALDTKNITKSGSMYAGIKLRALLNEKAKKTAIALEQLKGDIGDKILKKDGFGAPSETKSAFDNFYKGSFSHDEIRSLLEMTGFALEYFGYKHGDKQGRNKAGATAFLYNQYVSKISIYKQ